MNAFVEWLKEMPSTNVRIAVSLVLATFFVVVALVADLAGHPISENTLDTLAISITTWMAADVVQFGWKRKTHAPPSSGSPS